MIKSKFALCGVTCEYAQLTPKLWYRLLFHVIITSYDLWRKEEKNFDQEDVVRRIILF